MKLKRIHLRFLQKYIAIAVEIYAILLVLTYLIKKDYLFCLFILVTTLFIKTYDSNKLIQVTKNKAKKFQI